MKAGRHTLQEILSQGQAWEKSLPSIENQTERFIGWLEKPWNEMVFIGCGSTYYLSISAASIWQSITGISARAMPSSELWLFPNKAITNKPSILVAFSRSGETSETISAIQRYQEQQGDDCLSITCNADSQMARISPQLLEISHAKEISVAQTRAFTSMFLSILYLACKSSGNTKLIDEIKTLPTTFERVIGNYSSMARKLAENPNLTHFVFLGSGANYGLACEAMLKMKEMSLSPSDAFHFLEFRHGPKSMVTPNTLIIGFISDSARDEEVKVLSEMRALGAEVLALVEKKEDLQADYIVELNSGVSEDIRSLVMLPILQLMAYYRSISKQLDPDRPKNLDAVVKL